MQPHNRTDSYNILIITTLAKHDNKLPDDGLLTWNM